MSLRSAVIASAPSHLFTRGASSWRLCSHCAPRSSGDKRPSSPSSVGVVEGTRGEVPIRMSAVPSSLLESIKSAKWGLEFKLL